ncbi:transposase [Streptomyces sp. NPDC051018]|uniref:transposase n=1 Tax=Streptomyces sp. NPDC051018 TaxID=3365639 RepID=UPI0037ACDBE3
MTGTGASFLLHPTRKRRPTVRRPLPDGSYLTTVCAGNYRAGRGCGRLGVRIAEAWMTTELADGTRRTELWRLMTSLLDAESYPAHELITLYHHRWQAETCYFSLKSTILGGRLLRSRTVPGIEQEVYALLTVYQALVRTADDLVTAQPGLSAERVSLIVLLNAAADQIVAARGIAPADPMGLVGAIGRAALAGLLPKGRRWRLKARVRKRNSKYTFTTGKHPRKTQAYALHFEMIKEGGLDATNSGQTQRCCTQRDAIRPETARRPQPTSQQARPPTVAIAVQDVCGKGTPSDPATENGRTTVTIPAHAIKEGCKLA